MSSVPWPMCHLSTEFCENWLSCSRVILLTNKQKLKVYVLSTEPCTSKLSKVVHTYSPRQQVDGQWNTDDDTAPAPTQLDLDDDDTDEDVADTVGPGR